MSCQRRRPPTAVHFREQSDVGFSLLELMLTIGIIGVVSAIAVVQIGTAQQSIKGDGGMRIVLAQMNIARELALAQRRTMQVRFVGANTVQIVRNNVPNGTTVLRSVVLEGGVEFALVDGLPDTPDAFGKAAALDFGGAATTTFNSDGTFVDATGKPINGTVFLAIRGHARSARAVTVLGSIGRIRAYRWNGAQWTRV
jgi:prepilin-type N-terminal cleavage/methylation domain-containing protein